MLSLFKNLGSFLTTKNSTLRLGLGLGQGSEVRGRSLAVNSHVISASVHRGVNRVYLSEPVIFTLRHLQVGALLPLWHAVVCVCECVCAHVCACSALSIKHLMKKITKTQLFVFWLFDTEIEIAIKI